MLMPCKLCRGRGAGAQNTYKIDSQPCIKLYGDSCGPCREIISLETEIMEAQAALALMLERHRKLRGELNRSHSLITRCMPTEILSSIFRFCLPEELEKKLYAVLGTEEESAIEASVPLILGAVCQVWRSIAWSTPNLWNQLYIPTNLKKIPQLNELVQQWLSRSGDLPLKICTRFMHEVNSHHYNDNDEDDPRVLLKRNIHAPIVDTINQYASRWQDMYLDLPTTIIRQLQARSGAPLLRTVFICPVVLINYTSDDDLDMWLTREGKPLNVRLDLTRIYYRLQRRPSIDISKFNWNVMTHLELLFIPNARCIEILKQAPELTDLEINNVHTIFDRSIIHSKLRCFKYTVSHGTLDGPVPAELHLPALVELHCSFCPDDLCGYTPQIFAWFKSTFGRSSRLEKLFLDTTMSDQQLIQVLEISPSTVQHLQLTTIYLASNVCETFGEISNYLATTSLPKESDQTQSISFLPNLQSLTYVFLIDHIPWGDILGVFGPLHEINNPLRRPLNSLKVLYGKDSHYDPRYDRRPPDRVPDMYVIPKLIELQRAGINLEIRHQRTDTDMLKAAFEKLDVNNSNGT